MISFFACTGYKHFGHQPPLSFYNRHDDREFRDNMLYMSFSCSDWKFDSEMLRFAMDTHFKGFSFNSVAKAMAPFVKDNATPQLHLLVWQHSIDTRERMKLDISPVEQQIERIGQHVVTAQQYIAQQQVYYAAEYARFEQEEKNDAKRRALLEREREERRQKRLAKVATDKSKTREE